MLHIGQAIETNLYNMGLGYIVEIHPYEKENIKPIQALAGGVGGSGGSCDIDIIFVFDGKKTDRYPECLVGGQFKLREDLADATPEMIAKLKAKSEKYYTDKKHEQEQAKNAYDKECDNLRNDPKYAKLTKITGGTRYDYKTIKGNLQKVLKDTFPKTKFSFKKWSFLGINVSWVGLPLEKDLNKVLDLFKEQTKSYDGDCFVNDSSPFNHVFGYFEYTNINHEYSDDQIIAAIEKLVSDGGYYYPAPTLEEFKNGKALNMQCISNCPNSANRNWWKLIKNTIEEIDY